MFTKALLTLSLALILASLCGILFLGFVFHDIQKTQVAINRHQADLFQLETMSSVAASEAKRSEHIESEFNDLTRRYVRQQETIKSLSAELRNLAEVVSLSGAHIRACHDIMREHQVPVPASGLAPGEMGEIPKNLQEEFEFEVELIPADGGADGLPQFDIQIKSADREI